MDNNDQFAKDDEEGVTATELVISVATMFAGHEVSSTEAVEILSQFARTNPSMVDDVNSTWTVQAVEHEGGEGEGEYTHKVFRITSCNGLDVHVRVTGHYDSWNGTDWHDNWAFVNRRKVIVDQFFAADGSEDAGWVFAN
jgi:hypothetical protein